MIISVLATAALSHDRYMTGNARCLHGRLHMMHPKRQQSMMKFLDDDNILMDAPTVLGHSAHLGIAHSRCE